ncbi:MAG: hypothetical protein HY815_03785 [Candidatus Riflebacteria bacterium]|nr:hypothetical protein [Candidatus Riflebacteria bacterium]
MRQNEYWIWMGVGVEKSRHSRAHASLRTRLSEQITRALRLPTGADRSPRCLACHDLDAPLGLRGRSAVVGDGVSCEACHGPSSGWIEPHAKPPARQGPAGSHPRNLELGMHDAKDPAKRAEKCMSCHVGTAERSVDHELIAAGHPDLEFELTAFTANMPPHWAGDRTPRGEVAFWATGQAVQLRERLSRLAGRARKGTWPEYAELNCTDCHHPLKRAAGSWRQGRAPTGRAPGSVSYNLSGYPVLHRLFLLVAPEAAMALKSDMDTLGMKMSRVNPDRAGVAATAARAARRVDAMVGSVKSATYDDALIHRLLVGISGDGESVTHQGHGSALQAAWALDVLVRALATSAEKAAEPDPRPLLKAILREMFRQLETVSDYDAPRLDQLFLRFNQSVR